MFYCFWNPDIQKQHGFSEVRKFLPSTERVDSGELTTLPLIKCISILTENGDFNVYFMYVLSLSFEVNFFCYQSHCPVIIKCQQTMLWLGSSIILNRLVPTLFLLFIYWHLCYHFMFNCFLSFRNIPNFPALVLMMLRGKPVAQISLIRKSVSWYHWQTNNGNS